MKIAIPTRDNRVDAHFGHCEMYTIYTVDDNNQIQDAKQVQAPQGCGCKSGIVDQLRQDGITVMLAGNMGEGAVQTLAMNGIQVVRGCTGDVNTVINDFLAGKLVDSQEVCRDHQQHHRH